MTNRNWSSRQTISTTNYKEHSTNSTIRIERSVSTYIDDGLEELEDLLKELDEDRDKINKLKDGIKKLEDENQELNDLLHKLKVDLREKDNIIA